MALIAMGRLRRFSISDARFALFNIKRDIASLRKIYWNTVLAKALLCGCALLVFIAAVWVIPQWRQMGSILFVASLSSVTGIFNTAWFLQGLEKIVRLATISLVNRFLSVPLILLWSILRRMSLSW